MAEIALRTYVEQLDNLIERKQIDEVVAHCRHLLSAFPKHLDTYRMLGKALLEKGRHGDAADIFQRVLSVMPDDFIAHVGMSIVREDEANLDAALWHMERAFEAAPANGAIQQELCRLYGRRDGVAPTKARLTRGALARMYTQGGLYLQAEAELRSALAEEPDRIDLHTVLARVYWQSDQPAQAAQTCAGILQKLPYSLEANRILHAIFRTQGRPDDAVVYRQRVEALDPYEAFAEPSAAGSRRVEANKVTLDRLEYAPGMEDTGSPDWLASIGAKFEEPAARQPEAQPAWMTPTPEPEDDTAPSLPAAGELPDWLRELQPTAPAAAEPTPGPDWMRDIGVGTTPLPERATGSADLPDWLKTATGPLSEEAVPEWMRPALEEAPPTPTELGQAAAPETPAAPPPLRPEAEPPAALPPIEGDEVPAWLLGAAVVAKAVLPGDEEVPARPETYPEDELPEWMRTLPPPATEPAGELPAPTELGQAAEAEPLPAWMRGPDLPPEAAAAPPPAEPQPEWVQARAALEATEAAPEPEADAEALPDWLAAASEAPAAASEAAPALSSLDTWVPSQPAEPPAEPPAAAPATDADSTATIVPGMPAAGPADEVPAWLRPGADAAADQPGPEPDWLNALKDASMPEPPKLAAAEIPDWLKPAAPAIASPADEVPAWLRDAGTTPDADAVPEWMKPAETAAEVSPEAAAAPEQPEMAAPEAAAEPVAEPKAEPEPEAEPATELPAWLSALAPAAAMAAAVTPPEPEAEAPQTDDDMPAWLRPAPTSLGQAAEAGAVPAEAAAPQTPAMAETPAEEEGVPEWLRALPAANATPPAPAQVPDWLRAVAADAPAPDPNGPPVPGAAAPVELPDFLQPASPEAIARAERPFELQGEDDEPLAEDEAPEPDLVLPAEIPDWLKALAPVMPDPAASVGAVASAAAAESAAVTPAAEAAPETDETLDWLASLSAQPPAASLAAEELTPDLPPWAEPAAPGPTDTIMGWLAGRGPKQEPPTVPPAAAPEPPAEAAPEPAALEAAPAELPPWAEPQTPGPTDTIIGWLAAKDVPAAEPVAAEPMAAEPAALEPSAAPDLDGDEAMRWLESLAARQGANPDELITTPEERVSETPAWIAAEQAEAAAEQAAQVAAEPAALVEPTLTATPAEELPDWLRALEPAAGHDPIEPAFAATALPVEPVAEIPAAEPAVPEPTAEAEADSDEALRWLESLAARQGANPDELLTAPEDRLSETPAWIAAEQAAEAPSAEVAPEAEAVAETPVPSAEEPASATPPAEMPDWLRALEPAAGLAAFEPLAAAPAESTEPAEAEAALAATPADELPDWLRELAPAAGAEAIPTPTIEPPIPADMPADEIPDWLRPEGPPIAPTEAAAEALSAEPEAATPSWLAEALAGAGALVGAGALAVASAAKAEPEVEEPALAAEPLAEAPVASPAALESWLSEVEAAHPVDPFADTAPRQVSATPAEPEAAPVEPIMAYTEAEPVAMAEPDVAAMDDDEAMRWLEGLAANQGANPDELLTKPEERPAELPAWIAAEQALAAIATEADAGAELAVSAAPDDEPVAEPTPYDEMPDWLREALPTPAAEPAEALADNALTDNVLAEPSLAELAGPLSTELDDTGPMQAIARPLAEAPADDALAEPVAAEAMSDEDALGWLESLAVRQGANPEELLTQPDERPAEVPAWIAAEQATAAAAEAAFSDQPAPTDLGPADEPEAAAPQRPEWLPAEESEPAPLAALSMEPTEAAPDLVELGQAAEDAAAMDEDQALRWLEGLAAQQGANPEELLTAPEERPTETPAWIAAEQAAAVEAEAALEPEPVAEPEPVEAITPPTWLVAEAAAPDEQAAVEPLSPELAAALTQDAALEAAEEPSGTADLGRLTRLSERLASARRAKESEIEARFAEQRAQQEAARREVAERMSAWREAMEAEATTPAETESAETETQPAAPEPVAADAAPQPAAPYVRPHTAPTAAPRAPVVLPDYATALERLTPQVASGADLDHTIRELEGLANVEQAPAPVLRLLGDAYLKADRLPRALDAYRQALSRL